MTEPRLSVEVGTAGETTVTITRSAVSVDHAQALVLDADHPLRVGEVTASRLALWSTTAPEIVEVTTGAAGPLRIWNAWLDDNMVQAWQGTARLEVDDEGDDLGLRCFDGHATRSPTLVVRLGFNRSWSQPDHEER